MTAAATRTPDLLDMLDAAAKSSPATPGAVRAEWLKAIRLVARATGGTFHSGQVRSIVPEWAHGPESGALITSLVRSGAITWSGRMDTLGNTGQRAGSRLVKVYSVADVEALS